MIALQQLRRRIAMFRKSQEGNVAIIFAITLIPLIGLTGAAIDYTRAAVVRSALQSALDATALAISKDAASLSEQDLNGRAAAYFAASFNRPEAAGIDVSAVYSDQGSGSSVTVTGTGSVPTTIMGIMGIHQMPIGSSSKTTWGTTRLRVALVLDNTGSMLTSGKMGALKTATKNLLTQLKTAASKPEDVYVSIIPFVKDVNAGAGNYTSNWIYWGTAAQDPGLTDNASWDANNGTCSDGNSKPRSVCISKNANTGTCSVAGNNNKDDCEDAKVCSLPQYTSKDPCKDHGGKWDKGGVWTANKETWTPKNHSTWTGCVADRGNSGGPSSNNYDINVTTPDPAIKASLYPAEQYGSCPQAVKGLNNDWSSMTTLVDNMSPNGNTNQGIGLIWGWLSLAGGGPFTVPAFDPNYLYSQAIILLSDGMNTENRWSSSQSSIDKRMYDSADGSGACKNIKDAGITIYSIQVNTGSDPTSTVLQKCASDSSKFFLLKSADEMVKVFDEIGKNLTKLRIAQ